MMIMIIWGFSEGNNTDIPVPAVESSASLEKNEASCRPTNPINGRSVTDDQAKLLDQVLPLLDHEE